MEISFINVGYGEAILITNKDPEYQDGQFVMLIDGGSLFDSEYTGVSGRIRALDYLQKRDIRHIDLLVFSHVHEDHTCGLEPIINEIPVGQFWTSLALAPEFYGRELDLYGSKSDTNYKMLSAVNAYSRLMKSLDHQKITRIDGIHPAYYQAGDIMIDILGPEECYRKTVEASMNRIFMSKNFADMDAIAGETSVIMNNASLILRLTYKGYRVLLCGDTNAKGFDPILAADPSLVKADVFKIGHHGQADSVSEELVKAVDPDFIVCCASNDFRSNSSNEKTFETILRAMGTQHVTYLFHDGGYNAQWNPNTSPRNAVTLHLSPSGITWDLE